MVYQPIENYRIIGDMHSVALVGMDGSIDWLCFPHFDSPSVFAAILDDANGGRFQIAPVEDAASLKQFYWPETNVLVTRFLSADGVGEIHDFMPVGIPVDARWHHQLVRRVRVPRGTVRFRLRCEPAFDYARATHQTRIDADGASFHTRELSLGLCTKIPLSVTGRGVEAEFTLNEGESEVFVLRQIFTGDESGGGPSAPETDELFQKTVEYW